MTPNVRVLRCRFIEMTYLHKGILEKELKSRGNQDY